MQSLSHTLRRMRLVRPLHVFFSQQPMQAHCYREECGEEKEKPLLLGSGRGVDERKRSKVAHQRPKPMSKGSNSCSRPATERPVFFTGKASLLAALANCQGVHWRTNQKLLVRYPTPPPSRDPPPPRGRRVGCLHRQEEGSNIRPSPPYLRADCRVPPSAASPLLRPPSGGLFLLGEG